MSRQYLVLQGPTNRLRQHFAAVVGPFDDAASAQQAGEEFGRDFPHYGHSVQPWPDHWTEMPQSVADQLALARTELAGIQADIAFLRGFYA